MCVCVCVCVCVCIIIIIEKSCQMIVLRQEIDKNETALNLFLLSKNIDVQLLDQWYWEHFFFKMKKIKSLNY